MFWDAIGDGLRVLIQNGKVSNFEKIDNKMTLQQAFEGYAAQLARWGATVDTGGTPREIYLSLLKAKESLPRRPGVL